MHLTSIVPTPCAALKERNRSSETSSIGYGPQRTKLSSINSWQTVEIRPEVQRRHRKAKFTWDGKTVAILDGGVRSVCRSSELTLAPAGILQATYGGL